MKLFGMFFGILVFFLNGFLLLSLIKRRMSLFERIFWGFLLYSALFTFSFFVANLYGKIPYTLYSGWMIHGLFFLVLSLFYLGKSVVQKENIFTILYPTTEKFVFNTWENFLGIIVLAFLFIPILKGFLYPINAWDSVVVYDFYGYVFALEGNMKSTLKYGYFEMYPFYTHLMHTWAYLLGFSTPLFIHGFIYMCFVIGIFGCFSQKNPRWFAWLMVSGVLGITSLYSHAAMGYNNLAPIIFLTLAFLMAYRWWQEKDYGFLWLSALFGASNLWCRNGEPWYLSLLLAYGVGVFLVKTKPLWQRMVLFILVSLALLFPKILWETSLTHWKTLVSEKRVIMIEDSVSRSDEKKQAPSVRLELLSSKVTSAVFGTFSYLKYVTPTRIKQHLPVAVSFVWRNVVMTRWVYMLFFVVVFGFFISHQTLRKKTELWLVAGFFLLNLFVIFAGTYVFIQTFADWNIGDSAYRMSLFLETLSILFGVLVFLQWLKEGDAISSGKGTSHEKS